MVDSIESALILLNSDNISERFGAARYFVKNKHPEHKVNLVERRNKERVRHIKMALSQAISGIESVGNIDQFDTKDIDDNTEKELKKFLKRQAIHEFSGTIIHELSKAIGLLGASIKQEFSELEGIKTKERYHGLRKVFQGIENLHQSAKTPKISDFDLAQIIQDLVATEEAASGVVFNLEGVRPCLIRADQSILYLALSNGIRNSIEAIKQVPNFSSLNNIVVCWGVNDFDIWVSIIDNGVGLHGEPCEAFKIGSSNKEGHIGFGLAILSQCMETLGGYAELSSVESGGAKLILRWNKE